MKNLILAGIILLGFSCSNKSKNDSARTSETEEINYEVTPGSMVAMEKSGVKLEKADDVVTIAELYAKPERFEGKTIRVQGEVTRFNEAIMNRNWIHIQDGTEHEGKFDLTMTSNEVFLEGSIVLVEGIVALNLDFGYGYKYEILLEKANTVE